MSFDISRSTFRPRKNFLGVVMQQGRVQLDSDWNEWQSEFSRRIQAGTLDTVGQAVYPASTPNAFKITPGTDPNTGKNILTIGAGRYYVDGLLAENHGPENEALWDSALAELSGSPAYSSTSAATDFAKQPYLPNAALLPGNGPFLAYLDVWERDVTYLEDPDLIDKAVNIDTTGRLQTIWQVKLLDLSNLGSTPTCSTDIPAYDALLQAPAGRLTSGHVPNATSGPCCLAPNTGYTGQENQLYRVEIHQAGTSSAPPAGGYTFPLPSSIPTFKWSRDNASVETSVSAIATVSTTSGPVSQLTVASLGRDRVLGFAINDWIEITDDAYELLGQAGEIYQIANITPSTNTITLNATVSSHFPSGQTTPDLHTRIRRWDQSGKVYQTDSSGNTTLWIDLGAKASTGLIPVPPTGTMLVLENGVTVSFDLSPEPTAANPTAFRVADYWLFAARTADGSVETLTEAPPFGIHHHYARLAIVTFPSTVQPCRVEWPPSQSACNCACTVTVSPTDISGNTTLQSILDKYKNLSAPTTICLEPGIYSLHAPLRLTSAHNNITIEACQPNSVRIQALAGNESSFNDGLIVLDNSDAVTLSDLNFWVPASSYSATTFAGLPISSLSSSVAAMAQNLLVSIGIRVVSGTKITIQNCNFALARGTAKGLNQSTAILGAGILLNGQNEGLQVEGCEFLPGNADLIEFRQSFFTGVALASSISFAATTAPAGTAPSAPTNVAGAPTAAAPVQKAAGVVGASTAAVEQHQPANSVAEKTAPTAKLETRAVQGSPSAVQANAPTLSSGASSVARPVEETGVQLVGGQFQNIASFGAQTPATLASQGGTVLPATLDQAVLRDNTFLRLTSAALLLGETGSFEATANQIEFCQAGLWTLTPSLTQFLLFDPQGRALLGSTIALSLPLPQGDTSSGVTIAAAPASTRIYTGANNFTDSQGNVWVPDTTAKNVAIGGTSALAAPTPVPSVTGTSDPTLYQAERYGNSFSYTFSNLPAGFYSLTLKFAEIVHTTNQANKGVRLFNVSVNGQQVLTDFDIVAAAGGALIATDRTYVVPVSSGQIVVQFTGTSLGSDQNAKIDAVELDSTWSGAPFLGAGNESDSTSFFDQLAQLARQAYVGDSSQAQFRIEDNEMHDLNAPGLLLLQDDSVVNGNSSTLMMIGNRIDGQLNLKQDFAGVAAQAPASLSTKASITAGGYFYIYFLTLATIGGFGRAVVTSNMLTSTTTSSPYSFALILLAADVKPQAIAVMSNVFVGLIAVEPLRNFTDPNLTDVYLADLLKSWQFMNTVV